MKTRRFVYGTAFLLPVGLYLIVLFAARVIPFGGSSLLLWDANHFYAAFLEYWRGALLSQQDFFYSFSRALGQSMAGLSSYFLLSPLNLLLLLFPEDSMPLFFSALILLKIGLCGLTFSVLLQKWYQSGPEGLIFSTSYALMGFTAVYAFHVMWLDVLILLPLVALGIHKIADGKRPFLYIVTLGLAIVCQYYIGYMVCLFSALYFLYLSLGNRTGFRVFLRRLCRFLAASLLSAGVAAVVLIPSVYAVSRGYALFDTSMLTMDGVGSVFGVLTKVYTASVSVEQLKSGGPNLYIGIPLLVFAALYFACRAVPLRKRLASLGFAAVFIVSFLFAAPYYFWHGFNAPNFFPARFSFLFSFLLLELAWQGYRSVGSLSKRSRIVACTAAAAGFLALTAVVLTRMQSIEYLAVKTVVLDAAFFCITCLLVFGLCGKKRRTIAVVILCALQAVCLLLNAYYPIVRLNQIWSSTASAYTEETERGKALVARVKASDGGLYRMELDFHRTDTDPFAYDYSGLTHFSPDADAAAIEFFDKLGLRSDYYHIRYAAGASPVLESLFGLKYILRKDGVALGPLPEGYEALWTDGDVTAYRNAYALPFAYLVPEQAVELSGDDPFVNQNTLLSDLTGEDTAVFEPVTDVGRTYDGTWETYTFSAQANRRLYMQSFGTEYVVNGAAVSVDRLNGTILLPVSDADTTYDMRITAPLSLNLAYFDADTFETAYAVLAAHGAEVTSDTDSHLVIHADVTDEHTQLLITLPFDEGWRVWVDGIKAETTSRYGALLAVNLTEGAHTVELRFVPDGLWAGVMVSAVSLLLVIAWLLLTRKHKEIG